MAMSEKVNLGYLLKKFTTNTCTKEELQQLLDLIEGNQDNEELMHVLRGHWLNGSMETRHVMDWKERSSSLLEEAKLKTQGVPATPRQGNGQVIKWLSVAAALLLIFGGYYTFYAKRNATQQISKVAAGELKKDIPGAPGGNKAVLTLADGSVIDLDSASNGTIARQGNTKIIKGEDGELINFADKQNAGAKGFNIISTPRGGKYTIVLSDGTKVWLNAASSLKFPVSFTDSVRQVVLTGEGYFEVAKDASMPFHVTANDVLVEVLGTHFNVNAYTEENAVATTLLEGSVKVKSVGSGNNDSRTSLLKPGEQANFSNDGKVSIDHDANTGEATAWKDNRFEFDNTPIPVIMRQIARWYNVEIDYKGAAPLKKLTGKFNRNVSLSQLVVMLQYTGVNMKIDNNKISIREN